MMKKWLVMGVGVSLLGAAFFGWNRFKKPVKTGRDARHVVEATLGTIEDTVEATGEIRPLNRVEIKPPIAGRIEKLLVEEGDRVKSGDLLAWMSSSDRAAILDAARAKGLQEVRKWEDTYKPTPIVAPLSGVIILKNVVVGQTVDASTILFAMSDKLIVIANVDETDIGRVQVDMPATITLDSYPEAPIQGKVFQILYEGKNVSNVITYGAKIEPVNAPPFFRSQMTANIRMIARKKENVILLPAAAVSTTASGTKQVFVPGEKGKPEANPVKTGLESGDSVEITEGLKAGDKVLIMSKRYTPQRAASSPLTGGGARRNSQDSDGRRR